jgi:hypothetical protein
MDSRKISGPGAARRRPWALPLGLSVAALGTVLSVSAAAGTEKVPAAPPVRVSLDEGRRMVRMMDDIYKAAVITTHRMYVQDPGTPAAVIWAKQVVREVHRKGWPEARILAAVERPLNPENYPADPFERQAIQAFRSGKPSFEKVEPGSLRYATEIRIDDRTCLTCHVHNREGDLLGGVSYRVPLAGGAARPGSNPGKR